MNRAVTILTMIIKVTYLLVERMNEARISVIKEALYPNWLTIFMLSTCPCLIKENKNMGLEANECGLKKCVCQQKTKKLTRITHVMVKK